LTDIGSGDVPDHFYQYRIPHQYPKNGVRLVHPIQIAFRRIEDKKEAIIVFPELRIKPMVLIIGKNHDQQKKRKDKDQNMIAKGKIRLSIGIFTSKQPHQGAQCNCSDVFQPQKKDHVRHFVGTQFEGIKKSVNGTSQHQPREIALPLLVPFGVSIDPQGHRNATCKDDG
jgi:hypothetical protein